MLSTSSLHTARYIPTAVVCECCDTSDCRYSVYTITPHSKNDQGSLPKAAAARTDTYTYTKGILTATSAGAGTLPEGDSLSVDNGLLQLNFSKTTGRLTSLANHQAGVATNLTMDMVAYLSGKLPDASLRTGWIAATASAT